MAAWVGGGEKAGRHDGRGKKNGDVQGTCQVLWLSSVLHRCCHGLDALRIAAV